MDASSESDPQPAADVAQAQFELGLALYKKQHWRAAAAHFRVAEEKAPRADRRVLTYRAYHGLALVCQGDVSGLNLCRNAAAQSGADARILYNLARAELQLKHRRRACEAVSAGLRLSPRHAKLLALRERMGVRRPPCVPFLDRDNPLNRWLGKLSYRARHSAR